MLMNSRGRLLLGGCMLMKFRGGFNFGGCMLMNSRGEPPHLERVSVSVFYTVSRDNFYESSDMNYRTVTESKFLLTY